MRSLSCGEGLISISKHLFCTDLQIEAHEGLGCIGLDSATSEVMEEKCSVNDPSNTVESGSINTCFFDCTLY